MDLFFLLSCCGSDIIPPVKRIRSMHNVECKLKIAKWGGQEPCFTFSFYTLHFAFPCHSPILSTARKASCGSSMLPTCFILFLPSFCFSRSFRFLVISPPYHFSVTFFL